MNPHSYVARFCNLSVLFLDSQGHAWTTDFGNPDKPEEFEIIHAYSPLHNVRRPAGGSRQYPAVLITTGKLVPAVYLRCLLQCAPSHLHPDRTLPVGVHTH